MPRITALDDPLSSDEHLQLGMAYEKNGEYDLAIREYKSVAKDLPVAHLFLGNLYFLKADYESAEKHYELAIQEISENPRPYNNLAWLYYTQGVRLREAEDLARQAVKLAPEGEKGAYRDTLELILKARTREEHKDSAN